MRREQRLTNNSKGIVERTGEPVTIHVIKERHVALARQRARGLAEEAGLKGVVNSYLTTSVSEVASNLFFHTTRGGTIQLVAVKRDNEVGVEFISQDQGPGIPDLALAMKDGFTTNGGLGGGLPGVKRMTDEFDITSTVGVGTTIVARVWQPLQESLYV